MINLFIDTNIFLNFFSHSDEDLEKLSELQKLINETSQIKLFVSTQLVDEFSRNRESKIKETMKKFNDSHTKIEIPKICSGYDEVEKINSANKIIQEEKRNLIIKLNNDIERKTLKADVIISHLFSGAQEISEQIFINAKRRFDLGNPPGKNKSYGDAVNWEFLMLSVPKGENLHFVGTDIDFTSPLNENSLSQFLLEEWDKKKNSKIIYYRSLNNFFKAEFPELQLNDDYIIDINIQEFSESKSFDSARSHLKRLCRRNEFSDNQINNIVKASITNDQIYVAHKYSDYIGKRLKEIIKGHEDQIPQDDLNQFNVLFYTKPVASEIPF